MGNPKQKWTSDEEEALRAGVANHGTEKWKIIQKDPEFNHYLFTRSNIDLKEGASKEDIDQLSRYKFRRVGGIEKIDGENQGARGGIMTECGTDAPTEHVLSQDDAECCICLSAYDDGVELRELPCGHHFHCTCVDKWLYINATCPLCKYNILKSSGNGREEV